ncbi:uncharacterized protein LOC123397644 [Hordeum vulgare subsp. vulgare]|uniref:CUE domain-containing protein n=1 Tax=Hordeum vulgare subsp. vulgare TaxID=112509 RepID=M0XA17_HORVV|nr:uncharacterized protein LOC123397644 [Hordeum vulgare subsp. vulgare]
MSASMCRKRASSFSEEHTHAEASSSPPSKRARFRADGGSPRPRGVVDSDLVAVIRARFPSVRLEFIEKALEECENDLDSAMKYLLPLHLEPTGYNVDPVHQSPNEMSTEVQVPNEGIAECNEVPAPVGSVLGAENLQSGITQWVEILMNEMASASNSDDAKARASIVLEAYEKSTSSCIRTEAMQKYQKDFLLYKEQFEAVNKENTILKKAVAIQHERQKEHDERNQELQQLKQLVMQYREQIRSLEINNYALSMHLRQSQQGNSIPGHFHRDIL